MIKYIPFITLGLAFILIVYLVLYMQKRKKQRVSRTLHFSRNKSQKYYYYLYRAYSNTPLIKRFFLKMKAQVMSIYPADMIDVNIKATRDFSVALATSFMIGLLIIVMSGGDAFFIGIGLVTSYVLFTQLLSSKISKMEDKLDEQFSNFLTDVRHYYHDTGDVADAVYNTFDDLPYEISLHINKIYEILLSTKPEEEVTKYTDIAPNEFLLMFAAICSTIKEYGDKVLDDGQWLFLKNLNYLKEELNVEILKKKQNNYMFKGLKTIAVLPIFFLKPIELWAISNMPEMSEFYRNGSGTIAMSICFAITILIYQLISNLKDGRVDEYKENVLLHKLANLPFLRWMLTAEINRNYTKSLRIGNNLKITGENIGPREFLLKRILYGIGLAIAFNIVVIFANYQQKNMLLHDFSKQFENSIVPSEEYRENMRIVAEECINNTKGPIEDEEQYSRDLAVEKQIKYKYAQEIVTELNKRYDKLGHVYYKWHSLILTVVFFFMGFSIPWFLLWYQIKIIKMNMEDEVARFQTLALILINVDGMTINTLLEWMERFAFCFKASITTCLINLEASERNALEQMKEDETFPSFRRFVDNLLSIDNVGIVSAFDELESEKEFYKKKREQDNTEIVKSKSSMGRILSYVPVITTFMTYLVYPFGMMALSMMDIMNEALSGL